MGLYFEEGKYRVRIESQALAEGNQREDGTQSNPSLQLQVMPIGRYEQGGLEEVHAQYGRTIFLPLSEGTIGTPDNPGWVLLTLRYLGWKGESFSELDTTEMPCHSFVGVECDAICQHDEYQGKQKEKWSIFRPRQQGEAIGKTLEKKGLKALDAKFGKVLKATSKLATPTVQQQTRPEVKPATPRAAPQPSDNGHHESPWDSIPDNDPTSDIPF